MSKKQGKNKLIISNRCQKSEEKKKRTSWQKSSEDYFRWYVDVGHQSQVSNKLDRMLRLIIIGATG